MRSLLPVGLFSLLLIFFTIGCKKGSTEGGPIQVPYYADTLSSGWTVKTIYPGLQLSNGGDIFFSDVNTGYVSNNSHTILKTTDGGNNWLKVAGFASPNIAVTPDHKAFFVDNNQSYIYRTTDGGISFDSLTSIPGAPSDIFFSDNTTGLCSTTNWLLMTNDGGVSWNDLVTLPSSMQNSNSSIFMLNNNAWVVNHNKIFHSNGGLSNWRMDSVITSDSNLGLQGIAVTSPNVVYVSSTYGSLFKSVNGGNSFSFVTSLEDYYLSNSFSDLCFVNSNTGYMSLGHRIYKTTDAGNTWTVVVALGTSDIVEIHFVDETHGWAICSDGSMLKFN